MTPPGIALIVAGGFLLLVFSFALGVYLRLPHVIAKKMQGSFESSELKKPDNYTLYRDRVKKIPDLAYPSALPNNRLDLYLPAQAEAAPLPLLLWIHGGGFVAGVKEGTEILMTMICAKGVAVASMDYALAPGQKFPSALRQIGEAVKYLQTLADEYPQIDPARLFLGGDSAGGHYCAQYAAILTDKTYAANFPSVPLTAPEKIKGIVLCSAPLDISAMLPSVNFKLKLLSKVFFNGYYGFSPKKKKRGKTLSRLCDHVGPQFPPTFLTDGNTYSFESQNRSFGNRLRENSVPVKELYFDKASFGTVNHDYLFELDSATAQKGYQSVIEFLEEYASR